MSTSDSSRLAPITRAPPARARGGGAGLRGEGGVRGGAPEPLERPRAEVLDEHVGAPHELEQDAAPLGPLQVELERALVATAGAPVERVLAVRLTEVAGAVARSRALGLGGVGGGVRGG